MQNFAITVAETQFISRQSSNSGANPFTAAFQSKFNLFFAFFFAAELAINAFARWFHLFASNPWNWFDSFFVAMALALTHAPDKSESLLTSLQAVGVLRVLGRVPMLRKVVSALAMALLPVFSVFVVLLLVISIGAFPTEPVPFGAPRNRTQRAG